MKVSAIARSALVALAALVTACNDSVAPRANTPKLFTLVSADAAALPAQVFQGDIPLDSAGTTTAVLRVLAVSGSFTLDSTGHYEHRVTHDFTINDVFHGHLILSDRGECTTVGNQLNCESGFVEGVQFTGVINGSDVTVTQDLVGEGVPVAYKYHNGAT